MFQGIGGGFRVFAIIGDGGGSLDKKNPWNSLFEVEDPRSKLPRNEGKFLDAFQALEVARYDIQYCDWKARRDVLAIMLLHEKVSYSLKLYFHLNSEAKVNKRHWCLSMFSWDVI